MKDGGEVRRVIVPWLYLLLPGLLPSQRRSKDICLREEGTKGRVEKRERETENTELNPIRHCSRLCLESTFLSRLLSRLCFGK